MKKKKSPCFLLLDQNLTNTYLISSYSFRGNYSSQYINQRSQYIKVRKLFKGGNYSRGKLYEEIQYTDFSLYCLTHREVACIFV